MTKQYRPVAMNDFLICVRSDDVPTQTAGGLHLPGAQMAQRQTHPIVVKSIGPEVMGEYAEGDVIVAQQGGEFFIGGESYLRISEADVLAKLEEAALIIAPAALLAGA